MEAAEPQQMSPPAVVPEQKAELDSRSSVDLHSLIRVGQTQAAALGTRKAGVGGLAPAVTVTPVKAAALGSDVMLGRDPLLCGPTPTLATPVPSLDTLPPAEEKLLNHHELEALMDGRPGLKSPGVQGLAKALKRTAEEAFAGGQHVSMRASDGVPARPVKMEAVEEEGQEEILEEEEEEEEEERGLRRSKRVASTRSSTRQRQVPRRLIDSYNMDEGMKLDSEPEDEGDVHDEAQLKSLLAKKMRDLDKCVARTKGLSAADKKRVRNRHASCVSRLKKKLFVHNLQTELDKANDVIGRLRESMRQQSMEIRLLQRENQNLRERLHGDPPSAYYPAFSFN